MKGAATEADETPKAPTYKLVHGVVQDANGALPGATVWLHGTQIVVVTNSEGEFELRVPTTAKVVQLTCSYGGLHEEVVTMAPVQAMGSVYLLRPKTVVKK
ncbi:carboxypeptidase-like regulatory domain-containing protein [Hymenobacter arizonensis]|nr:carboxypeptidase-like regulatory domain-containing protein [Hymenobacter arizonensis]